MNAAKRRVVLKIGGSVLPDEASFPSMAAHIADFLRAESGIERLYIVVSAMKGATDRAIDRLAPDPEAKSRLRRLLEGESGAFLLDVKWNRPRYSLALLWGEIEAAHVLSEALLEEGVRAKIVTQLGLFPIVVTGAYLRSNLDLAASRRRFTAFERIYRGERVLILSGFGAVNGRNEPALLGRNASDYVAAILSALDGKVDLAIFLKDVGGIFSCFQTNKQRLIRMTDVDRLRAACPEKILDPRVLDIIACDFRVAGSAVGSRGTLVRRAKTA
jgi:aspartokinase